LPLGNFGDEDTQVDSELAVAILTKSWNVGSAGRVKAAHLYLHDFGQPVGRSTIEYAPSCPKTIFRQGGVTTGSARSSARGTDVTGPQTHGDAAIEEENRTIDRKVNSICRGC